jgi:HSP20 family protein
MYNIKFNRPASRTFSNLVDDLFTDLPVYIKNDLGLTKGLYRDIPVNILDEETAYRIEIVAPGLEKTDFKVNIEKEILTISYEKKEEEEKATAKVVRREYKPVSFKRSFTINEKVDATNISASYVNGILVLNLPKREEVKEPAKEIVIN